MAQWKRVVVCLLIICLMVGIVGILPAHATNDITQPAKTNNLGDHEYAYDRWANPINSYLVANGDGTLNRIELTDSAVTVETYDNQLDFVSGVQVNMELPLFGGFHSGQSYNFLVFGQENPSEQADCEVIRVVRYTKDWQRIDCASLCGANTTVPFDAGSLRFAEYGGYLYIRTAHEMYMSSDGLNHQANLTLNIRISDMTITDSLYDVRNSNWGYVSHSFNQFIAVDGTTLIAADHGDAYPRSVVLTRYYAPAGQDQFLKPTKVDLGNGYYTYYYAQTLDVLPIGGSIGANDTGVALGGFEISDTHYLLAGNTISLDAEYDPYGQRNIFIAAVDKSNFTAEGITIRYLTDYTSEATICNPHFVSIGNDSYCILWQEAGSENAGLRYAFINGEGQLEGEIYTTQGSLSDCKPIVWDNKLVWYVTSASAPAFFTIDLSDPNKVTHDHVYTYEIASYPSYNSAGALTSACTVCGDRGPNVEMPAIANYQYYSLLRCEAEPTCTQNGAGYYTWNEAKTYGVTNYGYYAPVPALGHHYDNGVCANCGETDPNATQLIKWVGTQVQANSNLDMQFALRASDLNGTTDNYIVLTRYFANGSTDVVTIDQADWTVDGNFYIVAYSGIAAKEMGDIIEAVVYNADGEAISEVRAESIETYALSMLGKITNPEQRTMFVDMLNYGAEAQQYFHHNEDKLVNANLTTEQMSWATQEDVAVSDSRIKDASVYGTQLSLENVVLLQAAFKPAEPTDNTCETAQELADNIVRGWNLGCSLSVASRTSVSSFHGLIGMTSDDGQYSRSEYLSFDDRTRSVTLDWQLGKDNGVLNASKGAKVGNIFVEQWNFALSESDICTFTVKEFTYTLKSGKVVSLVDQPITMQTDMSGGTGAIYLTNQETLNGLLVEDIVSMHCVMSFSDMNAGEPTPEEITAQETAWGNPVTTQEMIDAVADQGFNLIRVQVSYLNHMDAEGNIDELWLDRVQEVVDYCMNADVYCVINTSGYLWLTANPAEWEINKPVYTNLWKQISERFAGYGEKLIFESCNEVLYQEGVWSMPPQQAFTVMADIHQTFVDTVRAGGGYNKTRNLMINPYAAGYDYAMTKYFELPKDTVEDHLLAQVHCYVPQDFTFNETNLGSTNFRYEWGTAQDKWQLDETLYGIKKRFIDELDVPVVIGEFGIAKRLSESEAAEYMEFYAKTADKYDIQLILFDDGLDIAVFDRNQLTWTRPQVIEVLFAGTSAAGVAAVETAAEPVAGMTAVVTYTNYKGVAVTEIAQVEDNNGFAMVSVNSLAFADYETLVTITLYNADGTVAGSVTDSMASYAARANNALAKALMKFGASAYAYFC